MILFVAILTDFFFFVFRFRLLKELNSSEVASVSERNLLDLFAELPFQSVTQKEVEASQSQKNVDAAFSFCELSEEVLGADKNDLIFERGDLLLELGEEKVKLLAEIFRFAFAQIYKIVCNKFAIFRQDRPSSAGS